MAEWTSNLGETEKPLKKKLLGIYCSCLNAVKSHNVTSYWKTPQCLTSGTDSQLNHDVITPTASINNAHRPIHICPLEEVTEAALRPQACHDILDSLGWLRPEHGKSWKSEFGVDDDGQVFLPVNINRSSRGVKMSETLYSCANLPTESRALGDYYSQVRLNSTGCVLWIECYCTVFTSTREPTDKCYCCSRFYPGGCVTIMYQLFHPNKSKDTCLTPTPQTTQHLMTTVCKQAYSQVQQLWCIINRYASK